MNISANSKQNSKIFLGVYLGTIWGRFVEKTGGKKSRATVPLRAGKEGQSLSCWGQNLKYWETRPICNTRVKKSELGVGQDLN
jgi:hypothetical protein